MSRFDFDSDTDGEHTITWEMWEYNVKRTLRSANGQAKLREFRDALLAVPGHRLIEDKIADLDGDVCAIGAFAAYKRTQRGDSWAEATADLNLTYHPVRVWKLADRPEYVSEDSVDPWETQRLGMQECGLNRTLAWQLAYENDEGAFDADTPELRWWKAYEWVCRVLGDEPQVDLKPRDAVS